MSSPPLAATMPPSLEDPPVGAERSYANHPAVQALTTPGGLSSKLHPPPLQRGAKADFDPTFYGIGWGHKRKLKPQPPQYLPERPGKRTFDQADCFKKVDFTRQDLAQPYGPQMGAVRVVRARRQERAIGQDIERKQWETAREERSGVVQVKRREKLAELNLRAGCNPLTGGAPIIGQEVLYAEGKPKLRPRLVIEKQQATGREKDLEVAAARAAKRSERLKNDGLDPSRRSWTAREQMGCYDGFDMPTEFKTKFTAEIPKPGRRIFKENTPARDGGAAGALAPHLLRPLAAAPAAPPDQGKST